MGFARIHQHNWKLPGCAALLAAAMAATMSGCTLGLAHDPDAPSAELRYTAQYYNGRVVYFDEVDRPFYYEGGFVRYVPPGDPTYFQLVQYYRNHRTGYRRWFRVQPQPPQQPQPAAPPAAPDRTSDPSQPDQPDQPTEAPDPH